TAVFSGIDLVPSLLTLADVEYPSDLFDGENVIDTLLGQSTASRQAPIYWSRPPDRPGRDGQNLPDLAVRNGKWKLLCEFDGSLPQLYDLSSDPGETANLADKHSQLVARLTEAVQSWHASVQYAKKGR